MNRAAFYAALRAKSVPDTVALLAAIGADVEMILAE